MTRRQMLPFVLIVIAFLGAAACGRGPSGRAPSDELAAGFADPPDSVRPWVYWMWMDGNLTREGITADLEAMRAAGLGGVVICEVNVGVPRGQVEFMSADWRRLFKHVVKEAERLGLEVTLNAGPGWTGSGGPWVKPEQSMQHIVAAAIEANGPSRFDALLPRPSRRPAFFGEGGLPREIKDMMDGFYRDVAVLAFPSPASGPAIPDIDEKALYVRAPYSSQPGVGAFGSTWARSRPSPPSGSMGATSVSFGAIPGGSISRPRPERRATGSRSASPTSGPTGPSATSASRPTPNTPRAATLSAGRSGCSKESPAPAPVRPARPREDPDSRLHLLVSPGGSAALDGRPIPRMGNDLTCSGTAGGEVRSYLAFFLIRP
jgi:hypothetical protein